jgi:hypothetical protein
MVRRLGVASLIVLIVGTAFLGFASGDVRGHVLDTYPRHAGAQQPSTPHGVWKTPPVVAPQAVAMAAPPEIGALVPGAAPAVIAAPPRPPFVPPRG